MQNFHFLFVGFKKSIFRFLFVFIAILICISCSFDSKIDYNTQVKPILNKKCISCHGGVKQNGDFSLMTQELAFKPAKSGNLAIIPGDAKNSELIKRINHHDPEERMPQEAAPLLKEEIKILTKWIDQGADWGIHWAYRPLVSDAKPTVTTMGFSASSKSMLPQDKIDFYVKSKLDELGLIPNKEAEKSELLRRVSLDLIGMPSPKSLKDKFLNSKNPIPFEELVDSLMNLQSFGEKWATMWLDIARYADSKGFERDPSRNIWPYRDYVIKAFNNDKPYDEFVIEQMAGDLLENPTDEQYIATGFHRNTTTNDEGGTDNEEYRVKAVMDRVSTTWEGLMGTTMACVQCHGHPYDPFPHETYYESFAFFNNTRDADTYMDYPILRFFDVKSQEKLDSLKNWMEMVGGKEKAAETELFLKTIQPVIYSIEVDQMVNADLYDTKYLGLRKNGSARIPNVNLRDHANFTMTSKTSSDAGIISLRIDSLTGTEIGKINLANTNRRYKLVEIPIQHNGGLHDIFLYYTNSKMKDSNNMGIQIDWFQLAGKFLGEEDKNYNLNKKRYEDLLLAPLEHTLIMIENPIDQQRKSFVFDRGNWLVHDEEVNAQVPEIFSPIPKNQGENRLAFAKWMVNKENPLTSRTFVNRIWEQLFGKGIVETVEDLGSQGEFPTHLELLDYLSWNWMNNQNWSIKSLIKSIVLSSTYRQSAIISELALEKDPYNKYLSRGPRVRLSGEQIRDQSLNISGLLSTKMYGPPVMPYQPENIWQTPYSNEAWTISSGEDQHRRAVYTMIKRSAVYPSMETFDMPLRQVCTARRIRTNTPLQALVTLNDPVYVEASEHLASRMQKEGGSTIAEQINFAYQLAMNKNIAPEKSKILESLYYQTLQELKISNPNNEIESQQIALANVANSIINLDEMLNN